jgi:tetratricopeptide (TPR) repeat protein
LDGDEDKGPARHQPLNPATPDFAHASVTAAKDLIALGELRRARLMLESLVKQAPEPEALLLLAQLELDNPKRQPDALEHLRRAVALAPQYTQAWLTLANYWSLRGQSEKQRRCLEKILAYEPRNPDVRSALELLLTRK